MALGAGDYCRFELVVGGVEQIANRRFEPVGDLEVVGAQRQVGRDDREDGGDSVAGDRPVRVEWADDLGMRGVEV